MKELEELKGKLLDLATSLDVKKSEDWKTSQSLAKINGVINSEIEKLKK